MPATWSDRWIPIVPTVDGVLFEFRDVTVAGTDGSARIDQLDAVIPDHGVTVIAGPSGSGKSTMLRLCNRLEAATSGTVLYRGLPIEQTDPLELRREVAMVFQSAIALPGSVADNLRQGFRTPAIPPSSGCSSGWVWSVSANALPGTSRGERSNAWRSPAPC